MIIKIAVRSSKRNKFAGNNYLDKVRTVRRVFNLRSNAIRKPITATQPKRPRVRSCHPSSHFPFSPVLPLNLTPPLTPLHPRSFVTLRFGTASLKLTHVPLPLALSSYQPRKVTPLFHLLRLFSILVYLSSFCAIF